MKEEIKNKEESKLVKIFSGIIVLFLSVSIAFTIGLELGGFLVFRDNYTNENQEMECENVSDENEDEVILDDNEFLYGIDLLEKKIEQLDAILSVGKITDTVDLTDESLFEYAIRNIKTADGRYSLEQINEFLTKNLNRTLKEPKTYQGTFAICDYSEKNKIFDCAHHGGRTYIALNRIVGLSYEGDLYTVQVKKAISAVEDIGFDDSPYYKNIDDLKANRNPLFQPKVLDTVDGPELEVEPIVLFNNVNNSALDTFTYVFKKVDDNYMLVSLTY